MLLREQCSINMKVCFGRESGQVTQGVIVKLNGKKAKIRTDEARGKFPAGAVWSVPYSMLSPVGEYCLVGTAKVEQIQYSPFQDGVDQLILEAIACCYNNLSPENLFCDGEAPISLVNQKRTKLNKQLKGLFQAIGREVDEMTVYNWLEQKRTQRAHK